MISADHILIVDDSIAARHGTRKILANVYPDASVTEAKNADEGQKVYGAKRPDLGILDLNIPGRTGLELAEELLAADPGARLILCTANAQQAVADRAQSIGLPIIHKPISIEKLRSALNDT